VIGAALVLSVCTAPLGLARADEPQAARRLSPADLALLNRVTWGADAADAEAMARLGPDRWLDQQLHPAPGDHLPPAIQAHIDGLPISHTPLTEIVIDADVQNRALKLIDDPDQKKEAQKAYQQGLSDLMRQAADRQILRDIYSPDQLREQMTWFWFNHFNVHGYKANIRAMVGDYEDQAIRPHALGHFRDLLEATLRHPAMERYLDNADNAGGKINENYARELMELHTMGVGSGYTQKDVQELARILTGVGLDPRPDDPKIRPPHQGELVRAGLFEFNPNRHDYGDKIFLGHTIHGQGLAEVDQALDILARQPATAHHVSLELATYFVGDNPPEALVARMAQAFQDSDGDIAQVLTTLFHSREFKASLGHAFKDPRHYAISAVRLAYGDRVILNTQPIQSWINRMGEGAYNHETPDGYPMTSAAWNGPGQMAVRFEIARQIGSGAQALFKPPGEDAPAAPPLPGAPPPGAPKLETIVYDTTDADTLAAPTQAALRQAGDPREWNTLYLSSPDFMRR
jgi:uncharacterized protein (DUF1800 family)